MGRQVKQCASRNVLLVASIVGVCAIVAQGRAFGRPLPPPPPRHGACPAVLTADVVDQVNDTRRTAGVRPLVVDDRLNRIARRRSAAMAADQRLSHHGWQRALHEGGVRSRIIGENVAYNYSTATSVMRTWLKSEGHRANIVDPRFRRIGVGCVVDGGGQRWWTQVFAG